jgi:hypothetical protein
VIAEAERGAWVDVDPQHRRWHLDVEPGRHDDEAAVDPRRNGVSAPALRDRLVDLDRAPPPAGGKAFGRAGDRVDVAADRRPQLDEAVLGRRRVVGLG